MAARLDQRPPLIYTLPMACNRDLTLSGVNRDREALGNVGPGSGDIWQMSAASGGAPTALNFIPTLLCAVLGRLIAKTGTAIETEKLRLILMLLQLTSTASRNIPYRETHRHKSSIIDMPRFDEALSIAIAWGHVADTGNTTFLDLTDTSDTAYTGKAFYFPQVNAGETALALFDLFGTANVWTDVQTFSPEIWIGDSSRKVTQGGAGVLRLHGQNSVYISEGVGEGTIFAFQKPSINGCRFTIYGSVEDWHLSTDNANGYLAIQSNLGPVVTQLSFTENKSAILNNPTTPVTLDWSVAGILDITGSVDVSGSMTIGTLSGFLKGTTGLVSAVSAITLTTDVTGVLPIANGGTNATSAATAFSNLSPITTKGDLIVGSALGAPTRFPVGATNGHVLTVDPVESLGVKWAAVSSAEYFTARASQVVTAGSAIAVTDGQPVTPVTMSGNVTMTAAPTIAAGRNGQIVILVNDDTVDSLTLTDSNILGGSLLRMGATTRTIPPGGSLLFIYDSTIGMWVEHNFNTLVTVTPSIDLFTVDVGSGASSAPTEEVAGSGTHTPTFAWSYTGVPSAGTVDISAGEINPSDYPATISTPFTSLTGPAFNKGTSVLATRVFTPSITVNGQVLTTPTVTVTYLNRRYCGPNTQSTMLSSAQILGLDGTGGTSALSNSATNTSGFTGITAGVGEYVWYAFRNALGTITYMSVNGELAGVSSIGTVSHTNDSGFTETFVGYRSTNTNLGSSMNVRFGTSYGVSNFRNRIFMGPHTSADLSGEASPSAAILTLDDTADGESNLNSTVAGTYTAIKIETGEYLWFCHPDAISDLATIKDGTTGFAIAGSYRTNVSFTNAYGFTETYRCWRSDNTGIYPSGENVVVT